MGKIRRVRTKRHIQAVKSNASQDIGTQSTDYMPNESNLPSLFPINNLFKVTDESPKNDKIPKMDQKGKKISGEEQLNSKKDKRKLRHEKFLKKLQASKNLEESRRATNERQKTVVTGDLNPLTQALLDIEKSPIVEANKKKRKTRKKQTKSTSSERKRQNAQYSDVEKFKQILGHPAFKLNPLATINEHVKNVIKQETKVEDVQYMHS